LPSHGASDDGSIRGCPDAAHDNAFDGLPSPRSFARSISRRRCCVAQHAVVRVRARRAQQVSSTAEADVTQLAAPMSRSVKIVTGFVPLLTAGSVIGGMWIRGCGSAPSSWRWCAPRAFCSRR
jgi:hypothetical protein